jgi:hypothetical protein
MSLINHIDEGPHHGGMFNDLLYFKEFKTLEVSDKIFSVSYKNRKTFNALSKTFIITQIDDVTLTSDHQSLSNTIIDEDVVIIPISSSDIGYFHLIYNVLSEIEVIKLKFPNVKVKILKLCEKEHFDLFIKSFKNRGILEAYGIQDADIIDLVKNDFIKIKSLFFIYTQYNPIASMVATHNFDYSADRKNKQVSWSSLFASQIANRFLTNNKTKNNRKIFLSGLNSNNDKRVRANLIYKKMLGYSLSSAEGKSLLGVRISDYKELSERSMTERDELRLEKMFEEYGYEVIDPGHLGSISNQADLFASASHIVGLAGASFVNSVFCQKDTKILILNPSDSYAFPHKDIVSSFGLHADMCPRQKPWRDYTYSAEMIFNLVKRDFSSFLEPVL